MVVCERPAYKKKKTAATTTVSVRFLMLYKSKLSTKLNKSVCSVANDPSNSELDEFIFRDGVTPLTPKNVATFHLCQLRPFSQSLSLSLF